MRLAIAGLIIVTACSAPVPPAPVALQPDESAVYAALVASPRTLPVRPVLVARTLYVDARWWEQRRSDLSKAVERETLNDLGVKLRASIPVSTQLRALIAPQAVIAAADSPHARGPKVCAAYYHHFGEGADPLTVSRVGFNAARTEALMLISRESCGGESVQTVLLHRRDGQWVPIVISDEAYD